MVFKCAKLCVCVYIYVCMYVCTYICCVTGKQYSSKHVPSLFSNPGPTLSPLYMSPDDDDALTCLGRNIDTFHSIESFFLFLLSVSILREKKNKNKRDRGCQRSP